MNEQKKVSPVDVPWIRGKSLGSVIAVGVEPQTGCAEWYGGFVVCESVTAPCLPLILAAPLMLRCLCRLAEPTDDADRDAQTMLETIAFALGHEGPVYIGDLQKQIRQHSAPLGVTNILPQVYSSLEVLPNVH